MGVYKKGINWYIDYYLPNGKRKREKVGPSKKQNLQDCQILGIMRIGKDTPEWRNR